MKVVKIRRSGAVAALGIIIAIVGFIFSAQKNTKGEFLLYIAGALLMLSSLLFILPILLARKDGEGNVRIITDSRFLADNTSGKLKPTEADTQNESRDDATADQTENNATASPAEDKYETPQTGRVD